MFFLSDEMCDGCVCVLKKVCRRHSSQEENIIWDHTIYKIKGKRRRYTAYIRWCLLIYNRGKKFFSKQDAIFLRKCLQNLVTAKEGMRLFSWHFQKSMYQTNHTSFNFRLLVLLYVVQEFIKKIYFRISLSLLVESSCLVKLCSYLVVGVTNEVI